MFKKKPKKLKENIRKTETHWRNRRNTSKTHGTHKKHEKDIRRTH